MGETTNLRKHDRGVRRDPIYFRKLRGSQLHYLHEHGSWPNNNKLWSIILVHQSHGLL